MKGASVATLISNNEEFSVYNAKGYPKMRSGKGKTLSLIAVMTECIHQFDAM